MRQGRVGLVVAAVLVLAACGTGSAGRDAAGDGSRDPGEGVEIVDAAEIGDLPPDLPPDLASDPAPEESSDVPDVADAHNADQPPSADERAPEVVAPDDTGPEAIDDTVTDLPGPDAPYVEATEVGPDWADVEAGPEAVEPPSVYPTFAAARFDGVPLPKKVPGVRLFLSYTGDDGDAATCGATTWRLGNRVVLSGQTPDGVGRGRLTGATLYVDVDEQDPDTDVYPTLDDGPRPYPFVVDVFDADHQRLWRGRLREPIQIREYVARAMEEKAGMEFSPVLAPLVSAVLHADLEALSVVVPDLPGARTVRFSRDLAFDERLALAADPACGLDPNAPLVIPIDLGQGPVSEVELAALPEVPLATFQALTSEVEVTRLAGTADPADAVNVAVLSDGFLLGDKAAFELHAQTVVDTLLAQQPYASMASRVNVWRIWTPSVEAGVSYDCACPTFGAPGSCTIPSPACKDALRDTMYGSDFVIRSVYKLLGTAPDAAADRMIVPLRLSRVALAMSLSAPDGTPVSADAAFVLANDPKEAAFGLFYAAITTSYSGTDGEAYLGEVATHEFGHAFGLLGDEYRAASDICQVFALTPLFPNFSPVADDAAGLAWAPWATLDGPYPNTEDQGSSDAVGCFVPAPGGGTCDDAEGQPLVCRPQKTCKMKTNAGEFCPVCREHVLKRIFQRIDLLHDPLFTIVETGASTFRLETELPDPAVTTTWRVDGAVVQQTPGFAPLDLDAATLEPGAHVVQLDVASPSPFVRLWPEVSRERMSVTMTVP